MHDNDGECAKMTATTTDDSHHRMTIARRMTKGDPTDRQKLSAAAAAPGSIQ